jgi:hypothetical protein
MTDEVAPLAVPFDPTKPTIDQTRSNAIDSIRNNFAAIAATPAPVAPGRNYLTDGAGMVAQSANANMNSVALGALVYGTVDSWKCGFIAGTSVGGQPQQLTGQTGVGRTGTLLQIGGLQAAGASQFRARTFVESKSALGLKGVAASFGALVAHSFVAGNPVSVQVTISRANALDNFAAVTQIAQSAAVSIPTGVGTPTAVALLNVAMGDTSNGVCVDVDVFVTGAAYSLRSFRITEAMLCEGATVAPFPYEDFGSILRRCQRFYQKSFPYATAPAQNVGTGASGGMATYRTILAGAVVGTVPVRFAVAMRAAPTITFYNPANANANWRNLGSNVDSGAAGTENFSIGDGGFTALNVQVAGDGAQVPIAVNWTADARF